MIKDKKFFMIPEMAFFSSIYFTLVNYFGREGGFDKIIEVMKNKGLNYNIMKIIINLVKKVYRMFNPEFEFDFLQKFIYNAVSYMKNNSKLENKSYFSEKKESTSLSQLMDIFEYFYSSILDNKSDDVKYFKISFYLEYVTNCLKNKYHIKKLEGLNHLSELLNSKNKYNDTIRKVLTEFIKKEKLIELIFNSKKKNRRIIAATLIQILNFCVLKINNLEEIWELIDSKEVHPDISDHIDAKIHRKFFIQKLLSTKICSDNNLLNKLQVIINNKLLYRLLIETILV